MTHFATKQHHQLPSYIHQNQIQLYPQKVSAASARNVAILFQKILAFAGIVEIDYRPYFSNYSSTDIEPIRLWPRCSITAHFDARCLFTATKISQRDPIIEVSVSCIATPFHGHGANQITIEVIAKAKAIALIVCEPRGSETKP